jgi:hypothetical protein
MKTLALIVLLVALTCSVQAQTSAYCQLDPFTELYHCLHSCTVNGFNEGCGTCCYIQHEPHGNSCYVGGCCTLTGSGGICYDKTGVQCNNFYKCKGSTALTQTASQIDDRIPLSTFDWTKSESLHAVVGKVSPMFDAVIQSMQHQARDGVVAVKEGVEGHFYLVSRPHFSIKVTFAVLQDTWTIRTSRSDPKEGPDAPIMLEIAGSGWKLMCHDDNSANGVRVVATGSF